LHPCTLAEIDRLALPSSRLAQANSRRRKIYHHIARRPIGELRPTAGRIPTADLFFAIATAGGAFAYGSAAPTHARANKLVSGRIAASGL
jgi:hypothetical protein